MKAGAGHPMGPLTLADFVGLDTLGSICDVLFDEFRERRFAQPPMLRKMLAAGWFGRKSGIGFYDYSGEAPAETRGSEDSNLRLGPTPRARRTVLVSNIADDRREAVGSQDRPSAP